MRRGWCNASSLIIGVSCIALRVNVSVLDIPLYHLGNIHKQTDKNKTLVKKHVKPTNSDCAWKPRLNKACEHICCDTMRTVWRCGTLPDRLVRSQDGVYQLVPPSSLCWPPVFPHTTTFDTDRYSTHFAQGTGQQMRAVPILHKVQHSRCELHLFCTRYRTADGTFRCTYFAPGRSQQAQRISHLVGFCAIWTIWFEKLNTISDDSNTSMSIPPDWILLQT